MSKYILKKKYPGSPEVGTILEKQNHYGSSSYILCNMIISPEKYPEFWEKVVEKDYEILSIINNYGFIYNLESDGMYHFHNYPGKLDQNLTVSINRINIPGSGFNIHSVKRLSDGEIFTVGDKCNLKNGNGYRNPIIKIELTKNDNTGLKEYRNRETIKITLNTGFLDDINPCGPFELDVIKKAKQPLFKTEII